MLQRKASPSLRRAALGAGCAVAAVALVVLLAAREHHAERASLFSFGQAFPYITTPYSPQARPEHEVVPHPVYRNGVNSDFSDYEDTQTMGWGGPRVHSDWFPDKVESKVNTQDPRIQEWGLSGLGADIQGAEAAVDATGDEAEAAEAEADPAEEAPAEEEPAEEEAAAEEEPPAEEEAAEEPAAEEPAEEEAAEEEPPAEEEAEEEPAAEEPAEEEAAEEEPAEEGAAEEPAAGAEEGAEGEATAGEEEWEEEEAAEEQQLVHPRQKGHLKWGTYMHSNNAPRMTAPAPENNPLGEHVVGSRDRIVPASKAEAQGSGRELDRTLRSLWDNFSGKGTFTPPKMFGSMDRHIDCGEEIDPSLCNDARLDFHPVSQYRTA